MDVLYIRAMAISIDMFENCSMKTYVHIEPRYFIYLLLYMDIKGARFCWYVSLIDGNILIIFCNHEKRRFPVNFNKCCTIPVSWHKFASWVNLYTHNPVCSCGFGYFHTTGWYVHMEGRLIFARSWKWPHFLKSRWIVPTVRLYVATKVRDSSSSSKI